MTDCGDGGPLSGLRILDLASVVLGPYATMILGDLGADVIKVERPEGDSSRFVNVGRNPGMSGTAINLHRNKRSIVLNLRHAAGRKALLRIAKNADALIHNVRQAGMDRLGLGYDDLCSVRPDIVYCACVGYGSHGPEGGRPAYDDLIQGASGLAMQMGAIAGRPAYVPAALCDKIVATSAVNALLAGLLHRARTGEGQRIEVPMYETMVSFNLAEHLGDSVFEPPAGEFGYRRVLARNWRPYATRDGHVCFLAYTDAHWRAFLRIATKEELADDPRFATLSGRTEHVEELYGMVADVISRYTTAEWLRLSEEADIPASPVRDLADAREDPQLRQTGFLSVRDHPSEGAYLAVGIAATYSATPCRIRCDAPRLGEHTEEILRDAGLSEAEIGELLESGTINAA